MALRFIVFLAAIASPSLAAAALNIAPAAHATASSFQKEKLIVERRDSIPRNAVDGNAETGWQAAPDATGAQWLRLDFTRPWPMRFAWQSLATHWDRAPQTYRWEVSRDGVHWHKLVQRHPSGVSDTVSVAGEGAYLRVVVNAGEPAALREVETYAGANGSGTIGEFNVERSGNRADIEWNGSNVKNVFLYQLTRGTSLAISDSGGKASVSSLIAEGPLTQTSDRVEFPFAGFGFEYAWTLAAYAPNGKLIGEPVQNEIFHITERSPTPFALRGVVEGYYGPGYSSIERADLVRFIGTQGGNFYLYGPKLDPLHRERWREAYPAGFISEFAELVETGLRHGVTVAWSLSPGLDYQGTPADDAAAIAKYMTMYAAGVRWFALFMDDIPIDADVTAATEQVALANRIHEALAFDPDNRLIFVPTVYYGEESKLSAPQRRYLETLASLAPSIYVVWTGTGVFAPTMTAAQMAPIADLVGHPLILWDNVPVADYFLGRRLNLGPLTGRAVDLAGASEGDTAKVFGYMANTMWLPAANRLPLATILDYLLDPVSYEGENALATQIAKEAPADLQPLFARWVDAFYTNPLVGVTDSTTTRMLAEARASLGDGQSPSPELLAHAAALYVVEPALADLYFTDLAGDLVAPARDAAKLGEALLRRWQAWAATDENERSKHFAASEAALQDRAGWIVSEGADEALLKDFGADVRLQGAPQITGELPATTVIGRPRTFRFALDGGEGQLFGLPGATLKDGLINWTPGHTGEYRWVMLATNSNSTGVRYGKVTVVEVPATEGGCSSSANAPHALWHMLAFGFILLRIRRGKTRA